MSSTTRRFVTLAVASLLVFGFLALAAEARGRGGRGGHGGHPHRAHKPNKANRAKPRANNRGRRPAHNARRNPARRPGGWGWGYGAAGGSGYWWNNPGYWSDYNAAPQTRLGYYLPSYFLPATTGDTATVPPATRPGSSGR